MAQILQTYKNLRIIWKQIDSSALSINLAAGSHPVFNKIYYYFFFTTCEPNNFFPTKSVSTEKYFTNS